MSTRHSSNRSPIRQAAGAPLDISRAIQQDRLLIDRCLAGEVAAWEELYNRHHPKLLQGIKLRLGRRSSDPNLVDEIAARVWYTLVADQGQVLNRFDPGRGCRLATYLVTIAKSEASSLFRSERRRRSRERTASDRLPRIEPVQEHVGVAWGEFVLQLTPREREFLTGFLMTPGSRTTGYSPASKWQLSSRIHDKLKRHIRPN